MYRGIVFITKLNEFCGFDARAMRKFLCLQRYRKDQMVVFLAFSALCDFLNETLKPNILSDFQQEQSALRAERVTSKIFGSVRIF